jgi:TonB-dependent receptor
VLGACINPSACVELGRRTNFTEDKFYPGAHLKYPLAAGLQLRASWARSTGRPNIADLVSSDTIDDTNRTIVAATPDLKSQSSSNFDAAIEYYFEPVGMLSAAYFRKDISGFIQNTTETLTAQNDFGAEYDGYRLTRKINFGESRVSGYEFAYSQQMTFLPGMLKGLGVFANYTSLKAEGDRGGTGGVKATLTNFVPKTLNAGLSWRYRGFEARVKYNWASDILRGYNVNPAATQWDLDRETVDLNFKYAITRRYEIYCDIMNATQTHETKFRGDGKVHRVVFDEDVGVRFSLGGTIRL